MGNAHIIPLISTSSKADRYSSELGFGWGFFVYAYRVFVCFFVTHMMDWLKHKKGKWFAQVCLPGNKGVHLLNEQL